MLAARVLFREWRRVSTSPLHLPLRAFWQTNAGLPVSWSAASQTNASASEILLKHEPVLFTRRIFAAGNANGIARLTAIIVNLGLEKLAAGIVINLTDQGKADVVAQVGSLSWGLSHTMGGLPTS